MRPTRHIAHGAQLCHDAEMQQDALLTSRQVAERLSTTVSTVNRWVATGKLAPVMEVPGYHGARLFAPQDVDELATTDAA